MLGSNDTMKTAKNWYRIVLAIALVALTLQVLSWAQAAPAPVGPQDTTTAPPGTPGKAPTNPKMMPTGLSASGGSIANDVYTNSIYDFSLRVPPGWVVVPPKMGAEMKLQAEHPDLAQYSENNRMLLLMTENQPLKKPYQRRSIQISATRMVNPQGQSAQAYLQYSQKTAKEKEMAVEYLNEPKEVTINGQKLWWNKIKLNTAGGPQVADQYAVMQGSYLLQFFLVSPNEEGLKTLQPSIQTLDIKPMAGEKAKPAPPAARRKKPAKPAKSQPAQTPQ
jgi:hypothetical protein